MSLKVSFKLSMQLMSFSCFKNTLHSSTKSFSAFFLGSFGKTTPGENLFLLFQF